MLFHSRFDVNVHYWLANNETSVPMQSAVLASGSNTKPGPTPIGWFRQFPSTVISASLWHISHSFELEYVVTNNEYFGEYAETGICF